MSTSITNQATLASWLSSPATTTATLANAITINPATWTLAANGLGVGYTLNGNNFNITITPTTAGTTWPGLVNLQGGKIQSMGLTVNTNAGTCALSTTGKGWLIGNANSSGWVNTVLVYGVNVTTNNSGGFTGTGSRVYFNQCQYCVSGSNGTISGTYAGGIAGRYFSGTINKCLVWVTVSGDYSGGIVGGNASYYSVTQSRANGSITGLYQGGIVGDSSVGGFINNCYSLVSITSATSSGIMGSTSASTGGLGATTFNNIQNSYYLGTANANSGGIATASSSTLNINDVASSQTLLSSASTNTTTNINIQPYNKSSTFGGFNASTYAMATDSNGDLYIGGAFTGFGGTTYNRLFKYTVSTGTFSTMVSNSITDGYVSALYFDSGTNRLYVGGSFTAPQARIFYVDIATPGTAVAMGTGIAGTNVLIMLVFNSVLYVGGNFTSAGGVAGTANLASFSGGTWSAVGTSSLNSTVSGISGYTSGGVNYLYIGGAFTTLNGAQYNRCAVYNINTNTWSPLGTVGTNNGVTANGTNVSSVITVGSNIYYAGYFGNGTNGNGTTVASPALIRWNTTTSLWESTIGTSYTLPAVMSDAILVGGTKIYMFGGYQLLFNTVLSNNIWMFDTVTNQPIPICQGFTTNSGNPPNRSCWDSVNNRIYYSMVDGSGAQVSLNTQYLTKYNVSTSTFTGISPNTFNGPVYAMDYDSDNNVYYFGGSFTAVNGTTCNRIVKWDGTTWSALGTGTDNGTGVYSIFYYNGNVYVGGDFTLVGGVSMIRFAVWNVTTSTWSTLGQTSTGFNNTVQAISRFGSTIVAGGQFTDVNGTAVNYLARYNGSAWVSMGSLTAGTWNTFKGVMQMKYYASKNLLYITGSFGQGAGLVISSDGTSFSTFTPFTNVGNNMVAYTTVLDEINNILYIGGFQTSNFIAFVFQYSYVTTPATCVYYNTGSVIGGCMYSLVVVNGGLYMAIGRANYFSTTINNNFNGIYYIASGPAQPTLLNYGIRCDTSLSNWPFLYCNGTNDFWIFGNFTRNQFNSSSMQYNGTASTATTSIFMSEIGNQTPSYTTSYSNSSLPISEYSSTYWNKSVTPPSLVAINSSPYTVLSTAYNSLNYLPFVILTPIIVWNPATTYYPAALSSKQLNAQAYQIDGVTPLSGSFVYTPPANTFVTLGINTLSTTFTPTSNTYANTTSTANLNVTLPLYTYIFNQNDLQSFLNSTYYTKATLYNNITINPATWSFPTSTLASGDLLNGAGKTITIQPLTSNVSWNGLLDLQGGVVQNMTINVDYSQGGSLSMATGVSILTGTTSSGLVNGVYLTGSVNVNNTNCGGLVGASSSCTIQTCQVGNNSTGSTISGNFAGAVAGNGYTGSMDNIVSYSTVSGNNAGSLCGGNASGATISNARSNGTLSGINTGGFYGGNTGNCSVLNSYSLVTLNNSLAGGCVGTMASSSNLYVKNYYYLGTISNSSAGTIGYFPSSGIMHLFNVATQNGGNYLTSGSTGFSNSINVQYFGNRTSFTGLSSGTIYAYAYDSTNSILYIGGNFTSIGGVACNYVCSWNGSSISPISSGTNGIVYSLLFANNILYIGGNFTSAGGITANDIATWNGYNWATFGTGLNGTVYAINNIGTNIYVGGSFSTAGGSTANNIAVWDGSSWSNLTSTGLNGAVYTIAIYGLNVYVGGNFTTANSTTVNYIALWDGSSWSAIGSGANVGTSGAVQSIIYYGGSLYVGGTFTTAGGTSVTVNNIALWNGSFWSALPGGAAGTNGTVYSMSLNGTLLYIAGSFTTSSVLPTNYFSVWDITNSKWSTCSYYLNNTVQTVFYNNNLIYLGGSFTALCTTTGLTTNVIAGLNRIAQINLLNNTSTYTSATSNTLPPISNFDDY